MLEAIHLFHFDPSSIYAWHNMSTSNVERQYNTLKEVVKNSTINLVCPQCLRPFSRADVLYRHFRETEDGTHQGLAMRRQDFSKFFLHYKNAMNCLILPDDLPRDQRCFEVTFVVENYHKNVEVSDSLRARTYIYSSNLPDPVIY